MQSPHRGLWPRPNYCSIVGDLGNTAAPMISRQPALASMMLPTKTPTLMNRATASISGSKAARPRNSPRDGLRENNATKAIPDVITQCTETSAHNSWKMLEYSVFKLDWRSTLEIAGYPAKKCRLAPESRTSVPITTTILPTNSRLDVLIASKVYLGLLGSDF